MEKYSDSDAIKLKDPVGFGYSSFYLLLGRKSREIQKLKDWAMKAFK